ncbi:MAG: glyoxylate/hydroxypyruvate reductase A [Alphaproteobacteria bacterium]
MTLLLASTADSAELWAAELRARDLPKPLVVLPDIPDPAAIEYAIVAKPPPGLLASLPNLKAIMSLWAGVDHITHDDTWPRHVPLYRMIEPGLSKGMVEFVLSQVLNLHLMNYDFMDRQRAREWDNQVRGVYGTEPLAEDRTVGVLGLGEMGRNVALGLAANGFNVMGWSRTRKELAGVDCRSGGDGFDAVLGSSDILVNLLPLTPATEDILNSATFAKMKQGASLINAGRGQHVTEADLIAALDSGQLSRAVLDVYRTEPLPSDDPFWTHPKVVIYPHVASITRARTAVTALLKNIAVLEAGGRPDGRFDPNLGY